MTIGQRIHQFRKERGISLAQLEEGSGVSKGYLSQLENDTATNPSIDTLQGIVQALGIRLTDLVGEDSAGSETKGLPPGLADFAKGAEKRGSPLSQRDIEMLKGIKYRGRQPKKPEDWAHLYEMIRRDAPNWRKG